MYNALLHSHNGLRWLVLLALLVTIVLAWKAWLGKRKFSKGSKTFGLVLLIVTDIQFLTGSILYAFVSPITKMAFNDFGEAIKSDDLRFYAVEHVVLMTLALIFIHLGWKKIKKANSSWKQHRSAALLYSFSLLFILAAIPWNRALV